MPRPTNERQALERERDELPARVANYQRELNATPQEKKIRLERLAWQICRNQKRMGELSFPWLRWALRSKTEGAASRARPASPEAARAKRARCCSAACGAIW